MLNSSFDTTTVFEAIRYTKKRTSDLFADKAIASSILNPCSLDTVVKILGHVHPLRAWCNA